MSVISIEKVSYKYNQSKGNALKNISFSIEKGSYLTIAGKNGSGKSTLAKLICSLLTPDSGEIIIQENQKIGFVFQAPKEQIVSGLVHRDTEFGPRNLGLKKSEIELRTIESLNIVEMLHKAKSSTSALSLGQTQKIAFSGVTALFPEILILDEAVSMLDPDSRNDIYSFLRYWNKCGNTIIHITHDYDAIKESSEVAVISDGELAFFGTSNAFFQNKELCEKVFDKELPARDRCNEELLQKETGFELKNIVYKYEKASELVNIKNVSFALKKGTLTALTGPSGSGKSTLMEIGCGLIKPDSGEIDAAGVPVLALQNSAEALFENFAVDDVAFGPSNKGVSGKKLLADVKEAMEKANLPYDKFKDRQTFGLSGGEQKRLAIAGVLAMKADVVFFDEPSAGLDGESRWAVMNMMRKLADEGKTVVFSTHKMDEAAFADREIAIKEGEVVKDSLYPEMMQGVGEINDNSPVSASSLKKIEPCSYANTLESLRNITITLSKGEDDKKQLVQKLPAFLRILLFIALFALSICGKTTLFCSVMLLISVLYCKLCGFSMKKFFKSGFQILPFLLFFCFFQMIFHPALENEIRFTTWRWFMVTPSKLLFCLNTILRTDASIACICGFFISTPEYDLIDGLHLLLKPLEVIRIPVRYFILILEILFRFIPLMVEEASAIIKVQVIRCGFKEEKSKMKKLKSFVPLIVPLIIQTIKKSETLADAITMRYFK